MTTPTNSAAPPSITQRLYSLDALRGFDMFWIMGAEEIVHNTAKVWPSGFWTGFANQLTHPAWDGFHLYDTIFPLFLFMAGVATPYSVGRELEKGAAKSAVAFRVLKRCLLLILFGLIVNNGIEIKPIAEIRFGSVLGRIGTAYLFANLIYLYSAKKWHIFWFWSFLFFYWALLRFNAAPGFAAGNLTMEGNFASYIDRLVMPGKLYLGIHDPEGMASTIPAISTGLLGIITGNFIKSDAAAGQTKAIKIAAVGALFLLLAYLWNFSFPINKNLWSSSFTLLVGGISLLLMAVFYYVIDVLGYKKWSFFFRIIGMNSILIYMSGHFIDWEYTTKACFTWLMQLIGDPYNLIIFAIAFVFIKWLFLYFMYRKKVFLKV
jgi:predicted acyltransferase